MKKKNVLIILSITLFTLTACGRTNEEEEINQQQLDMELQEDVYDVMEDVKDTEQNVLTDLFENVEPKFSGIGPYGYFDNAESQVFNGVEVTYRLPMNDSGLVYEILSAGWYDLSNGDTIVLEAVYDKQEMASAGIIPASDTKEYVVTGLPEYIESIDALTESDINYLCEYGKEKIFENISESSSKMQSEAEFYYDFMNSLYINEEQYYEDLGDEEKRKQASEMQRKYRSAYYALDNEEIRLTTEPIQYSMEFTPIPVEMDVVYTNTRGDSTSVIDTSGFASSHSLVIVYEMTAVDNVQGETKFYYAIELSGNSKCTGIFIDAEGKLNTDSVWTMSYSSIHMESISKKMIEKESVLTGEPYNCEKIIF